MLICLGLCFVIFGIPIEQRICDCEFFQILIDDIDLVIDNLLFDAWEIDEIIPNSYIVESWSIICGIDGRVEIVGSKAVVGNRYFLEGDREEGYSYDDYDPVDDWIYKKVFCASLHL